MRYSFCCIDRFGRAADGVRFDHYTMVQGNSENSNSDKDSEYLRRFSLSDIITLIDKGYVARSNYSSPDERKLCGGSIGTRLRDKMQMAGEHQLSLLLERHTWKFKRTYLQCEHLKVSIT
jgi:hypothetical protein